jgi:hypothetical protein
MFQTIKRHFALFILVSVVSAVPAFANSVKVGKAPKTENFVIDLQNNKRIALGEKIISRRENHLYRVNLKQGEVFVFTVRSGKATALKVKSATGVVNGGETANWHRVVLNGAGEYELEVSTEDVSLYTVDVTNK